MKLEQLFDLIGENNENIKYFGFRIEGGIAQDGYWQIYSINDLDNVKTHYTQTFNNNTLTKREGQGNQFIKIVEYVTGDTELEIKGIPVVNYQDERREQINSRRELLQKNRAQMAERRKETK